MRPNVESFNQSDVKVNHPTPFVGAADVGVGVGVDLRRRKAQLLLLFKLNRSLIALIMSKQNFPVLNFLTMGHNFY